MMRIRGLGFVLLIGAMALIAPFAAPVVVADDDTVQAESDQASAPAAASAPEQASEPAPAKAAKPKMVCRKEPSTGSAIPVRICRTPRQVDADRAAAKSNIDSLNDGQSGRTTGSGG